MLNVITLFSGYDSQCLALNRLGLPYDLAAWCEIDRHAIAAHNALFPQWSDRNLGDVSKVDWEQWKAEHPGEVDLLTYSSPCQDFSSAGLQRGGGEGSGTRSGLLWEVERCIAALRPKALVFENVSALVSQKFIGTFNAWQARLNEYGYTNFQQLMNAKDYGVPQNRLRIFMVSILDCKEAYYFPKPFPLEKRLKDVLEKSVAESCYLSQERIDGLVLGNEDNADNDEYVSHTAAMRGRDKDNPSIRGKSTSNYRQRLEVGSSETSNTLTSVAKDSLLIEPIYAKTDRYIQLGQIEGTYESTGRVYSTSGISPTINTCCGGDREPKVLEPVVIEDFYQDRQISVYEGVAPTLRSDRAGLKVAEPIVLGWVRDTKGNIVSRPEVDVANCVTAGKRDNTQNYVLEHVIEEVRKAFPNRGVLIYNGNPYFVRKLSTRELFRLMDVEETDIDTLLAAPIPRTQHAKLAGNSIVVACLYYIFRNLFVDTEPAAGVQTKLF